MKIKNTEIAEKNISKNLFLYNDLSDWYYTNI